MSDADCNPVTVGSAAVSLQNESALDSVAQSVNEAAGCGPKAQSWCDCCGSGSPLSDNPGRLQRAAGPDQPASVVSPLGSGKEILLVPRRPLLPLESDGYPPMQALHASRHFSRVVLAADFMLRALN